MEKIKEIFKDRTDIGAKASLAQEMTLFLLGFLGLQVCALLLQLIMEPAFASGAINEGQLAMGVNLASYALLGLVFWLYLISPFGSGIKQSLKPGSSLHRKPRGISQGIYVFIIIYLVGVFYSGLIELIPWMSTNTNQSTLVTLGSSFPIPLFVMTVLLAPLIEEITYRGGLTNACAGGFTGAKRGYHPLVGILISSLIFGLIHFDFQGSILSATQGDFYPLYRELLNLPAYVISGAALAGCYLASGSLYLSVALHSLNNLIAFIGMI